MKTKLGMLAAAALAALMFASCGDETTQVIGTRTVADLNTSETCTIGDMVVNLADNTVYVCDGDRRWTTMKGDAGAKGDPGQQGEQGIPGVKGEDGTSCTARIIAEGVEVSCGGAVLDTLINGQDGAQGPQGVQGETGAQGPQGETGAQGPQGAQGIQGVKGEDGSSCTALPVANGVEIYCGDQLVATIVNGEDGNDGASCALSSINVNGVDGVEITCGAQKDTVMNGAQGIQGIQGAQGETGSAGASCSGVSLGDTAVVISCGGVVVDTLTNGHDGAQGPQGIQGVQGEAGQSCSGLVIDGVGIEISCGGVVVDTLRNGNDGATGASCTLASIEVNGVHGVEITGGAQKDTVMNGAQGIQGIQGAQGEPGVAGASCSGVSLGDTSVIISCGDVVVDTLYNGAQGEQGIQGTQGEAGQSCTGRAIDGVGIEISCGGAVVDTLRNGQDGQNGASCTLASVEVDGVHGVEITCGAQKDTVMNGVQGIQGVQGEPGAPGAAGASCIGLSLGDTAVIISCGGEVVDTLYNGAQGEQGIQGVQGEAGQSCTGYSLDGIGIEISCGGLVVDTLRNGADGAAGASLLICGHSEVYDPRVAFCDTRDGRVYKKVTIGTQTWMAENLDFGYPNETTRLTLRQPGASTTSAQKWCYAFVSNSDTADLCRDYGGYYQWHTAMAFGLKCDSTSCSGQIKTVHRGICPEGWHIPSVSEWNTLKSFVDSANGGSQNDEGTSLKAKWFWKTYGTDAFGWNGLPGGYVPDRAASVARAEGLNKIGRWWAASESSTANGGAFALDSNSAVLKQESAKKFNAKNVRCVKD